MEQVTAQMTLCPEMCPADILHEEPPSVHTDEPSAKLMHLAYTMSTLVVEHVDLRISWSLILQS